MTITESPPKATASPQAEAMLEDFGLEWSLESVPVTAIVLDDEFQSRFTVIDKALRDMYARSFQNGATFPAIICARYDNQLLVVDGRHRWTVYSDAGTPEVWAYVFDASTKAEIEAVAHLANTRLNGAQNTPEERLEWAVQAVRNGSERQLAADAFGVSKHQIDVRLRFHENIKRMRALGIKPRSWDGLTESMVSDINSRSVDEVLETALGLARQIGGQKVYSALGESTRFATTSADKVTAQKKALDDLRAEMSQSVRGLVGTPKRRSPRSSEEILFMDLRKAEESITRALAAGELSKRNQDVIRRIARLVK